MCVLTAAVHSNANQIALLQQHQQQQMLIRLLNTCHCCCCCCCWGYSCCSTSSLAKQQQHNRCAYTLTKWIGYHPKQQQRTQSFSHSFTIANVVWIRSEKSFVFSIVQMLSLTHTHSQTQTTDPTTQSPNQNRKLLTYNNIRWFAHMKMQSQSESQSQLQLHIRRKSQTHTQIRQQN